MEMEEFRGGRWISDPPATVCYPVQSRGYTFFCSQNEVTRIQNELKRKETLWECNENEHPEMYQIVQRNPQENDVKHMGI